jgi:hypothetical protein
MAYAVKTYGRDGWGTEFSLELLSNGRYRVTSAGADRIHGTPDDVVVVTPEWDDDNWEQLVKGFYLRRVNREGIAFVHRVEHTNFLMSDAKGARRATTNELFDMLHVSRLFYHDLTEGQHPILRQVQNHHGYVGFEEGTRSLLFVQIREAGDG